MGWKKLVVLGLSFLCISCLTFYHHPQGGYRPKKPDFSLDKEEFVYDVKIDTLAIYTKTDTTKYGKYRRLSFFKFYDNGRVFKSTKSVKEKLSHNNFRPLDIGYYIIKNDSIFIESFIVNPRNKNDTEYIKLIGIIKGDSIIMNNRFVKGDKDTYVKQKLDFVPEPSNW